MSERIFSIGEPASNIVRHDLHLGTERQREIGYLMTGREIHQDRNVEIRPQVEEEVLELIFLGPIQREVTEHNSAHMAQKSGGAKMQQTLVGDRHRIVYLFEEENRVARVDLVRSANRLLHERQIPACQSSHGSSWPYRAGDVATERGVGPGGWGGGAQQQQR